MIRTNMTHQILSFKIYCKICDQTYDLPDWETHLEEYWDCQEHGKTLFSAEINLKSS